MRKLFALGVLVLFLFSIGSCKKNKAIPMDHIKTDFQWASSTSGYTGSIHDTTPESVFIRDTTRFYWTVK